MNHLELYKKFLEYLSTKEEPISYGKLMKILKLSRSQLENLFSHMDKYYDNAGHIKGGEHDWTSHLIKINHRGVEYLRGIKLQEIAKNQIEFNKIIALTGCIIAIAIAFNYLDWFSVKYLGDIMTDFRFGFLFVGFIIIFTFIVILGKETKKIFFK